MQPAPANPLRFLRPALIASLAVAIAGMVSTNAAATEAIDIDWPAYLGGADSNHYSPLAQINAGNVHDLEIAWTYNAGGAAENNLSQIQTNPLVIGGVVYAASPALRFFALNAASGKELWSFDPFDGAFDTHRTGVCRGLAIWRAGAGQRLLVTAGATLFALDPATGTPIETFGEGGAVDLRDGLGTERSNLFLAATTPGVVYNDLYILGMRLPETLPAPPGNIRAYDVRTGAIRWTFRTIPRADEFGHDTWPEGSHDAMGGANNWAGMSVDTVRGIVYVPTGSAAYDFYGRNRAGDNLFANTLLALDATTGERRWHFQIVHHDVWDRDLPAPPNLVTIERGGERIDAVAQITKHAYVYVFDRVTGEPIFDIEEVRVSTEGLPGEVLSPTQPVPAKPPRFSRHRFEEDDITTRTASAHEHIRTQWEHLSRNPFDPPSEHGTLIFPGYDGGGEWGGAAVDPETGVMYVNASEMPWILTMVPVAPENAAHKHARAERVYAQVCMVCHGRDRQGDASKGYPPVRNLGEKYTADTLAQLIARGHGQMPSFEYLGSRNIAALAEFLLGAPPAQNATPRDALDSNSDAGATDYVSTGYHRFVDNEGFPAITPPWGTLNAIDLNKGEIVWKVTLGDLPDGRKHGEPPTGAENYGGPVVTAGGLIFIGATKDEKFRAFDKTNGELLWETTLPAGGYAAPAVYAVDGKQYVLIAAGGGKMGTKSGDAYVAFALP